MYPSFFGVVLDCKLQKTNSSTIEDFMCLMSDAKRELLESLSKGY
jgi:hypothetical protein